MGAIIFLLMGYVLYHTADAASRTDSLSVEQIAEELSPSEFIEGDIKLPPGFDRAAMSFSKYPSKRWPSKTVPYIISSSFSSSERSMILKAIDAFHRNTCIRFVPRSSQSSYVYIVKSTGCWSYVGRISGRQYLSLGNGCTTRLGIPIHELMHAIGFWHEQSRPDRDDYVTIHWDQIRSGMEGNFRKRSYSDVNSFGSPYDYSSVMHYSKYSFSKGSSPTITPKDPSKVIGQRSYFSAQDINQIRRLYNC